MQAVIYRRLNNSDFFIMNSCSVKMPRDCRVASFSMLEKISPSAPLLIDVLFMTGGLYGAGWLYEGALL